MRYLFLISFLVFMSSCQNRQRGSKPDDLIPEDKMVDVLTEISLVHGARSYNKQMLEQTGLEPREYIWQKFDIDSAQFARSNDYYTRNYQQYERIYDRVKLRLEGLKVTYDSLRELEEEKRDSLRNAPGTDTLRPERREIVRDSLLPDSLMPEIAPPVEMPREEVISQGRP